MENPLARFVPHLVGEYPKKFLNLFENISLSDGSSQDEIRDLLWQAYEFAITHHEGQKRHSGEPYFNHCLAVANMLAQWKMDHFTIIGGMLHDTIEDTDASIQDINSLFGEDIASLVNGVTKLGGIRFSSREAKQAGNFMKMLLSVAQDLRVIIIKFADRLHNMRTIEYLPRIKRHRIAMETRDVYAPLAHRLGMAQVKWQLEDLVLQTLNPKAFGEIDSKIKSSRRVREKYISGITRSLLTELNKNNIQAIVYGRVKSYSSIYGKMVKRGKSFEEIYDKLAIRLVVNKIEECYLTLGILHQHFTPIQDRFKDFIATPKSNAYQSIHTTVIGPDGKLVEIQIRTKEMEETAEIGVAAHWYYKQDGASSKSIDSHVQWLRELVEILQAESSDPREFMHLLKIDLFSDEIFVFTPNGDLFQLPVNATPIDFAFSVHTEVGLHCIGAKVDHKVVPLNTVLKNGDTVEVLTSKSQNPSYGWLKFVVTSKARNHINRFLRKATREESIKLGQQLLEKTLRRLKRFDLITDVKESYAKFGHNNSDSFLEAIGSGNLFIRDILKKIQPEEGVELGKEPVEEEKRFLDFARSRSKGIKLQGIKNLMVTFGKCCNPIPGDEMVGFVTRGRGITVHHSSCKSLPLLNEESDRLMPVEWDVARSDIFNVRLKVESLDRKGMLKEITEVISSSNINITSVDMKVKDVLSTGYFIVQVNNLKQLERVINKVSKIPGVDGVERTGK
ncbi:MAG: bifunctional (p)ppGpp synthetase/guanosine-3',5'-bis(diphosphate) 3'-pyrophosphohydrolase [Candidatus Neomarinimicrobiota bacterium]|nr:bifunctional (p)ppGpp synthetase/guanosine-3',5'-bis(diphosphate) 3'-pyrophosphohydrolase [Candidatus Neomarinimicrobiota bacterium]